ncbi:hypothetical protein [Cupriavidus gilardii]|uniref:hypothetical protein n=1 Tax=Cupriavidus gilardii TaxID=82541 RepID=UPI001C2DAB41|nr:hypothetical protein [Cupriavidus gilardii]MCG5263231.1 hypothetical protein [Cupriavidus gilardii]NSX04237.1 hypothetical protein [Cupriavidus gilardii]
MTKSITKPFNVNFFAAALSLPRGSAPFQPIAASPRAFVDAFALGLSFVGFVLRNMAR